MRHEDRLDAQAADEREHLIEARAPRPEHAQRVLDAAGLRSVALLQKVMTPTPDAVHFFRKIDHLKPGRKSAHEVPSRVRRATLHAGRKLNPRLRLANPA